MKINQRYSVEVTSLLFVVMTLFTFTNCSKSSTDEMPMEIEEMPTTPEEIGLTNLPLGDALILRRDQGDRMPLQTFLWLCGLPPDGAGNADASDWMNPDGSWDYTRKPIVEGSVVYPSEFDVMLDGNGNRVITGNALPDHPTGIFPIDPNSIAYKYDRNMNTIEAHEVLYRFPAIPEVATNPSCVGFGPSGISLSGSAIYHGASTLGNDAAAHEILDSYGGHTDGTQTYHYHFLSDDLQDHIHPHTSGHSGLMGYMLDGFGIYGPYDDAGELLWSEDLDECHGHTHPVLWDGEMVDLYHYHWTYDFPYNIGCYKGTPN